MAGGRFRSFGKGAASDDHARSEDVVDTFFVETRSAHTFLADDSYPFVVGAKGAGKSLLLFKKRTRIRQTSGTLVLPDKHRAFIPSQAFADLVALSHFWQLWTDDGRPRISSWTALWQWALIRTIVRGWQVHAYRTHNDTLLKLIRDLAQRTGEDFEEDAEEEDPFAIVRQLLERMDERMLNVKGVLLLPSSDAYLRFVKRHAEDFPQTYVFIDNHDDYFEQNIHFWIASATGTFLASRHIREVSSGRLHFYSTLRPEVVWELEKEDNFPTYSSEIHRIRWTTTELLELFTRRIKSLDPSLLPNPKLQRSSPLLALCGEGLRRDGNDQPMVRDRKAEATIAPFYQPVADYILRHTLRRPRDLIVIGNQILRTFSQAEGNESQWNKVLSGIESGRDIIARAYLAEIKGRWPWSGNTNSEVSDFIKSFPRNIVKADELASLDANFVSKFGNNGVQPSERLMAFGLLGFVADEVTGPVQRFGAPGDTSTALIPDSAWYVLHPLVTSSTVQVVRGIPAGHLMDFDPFLAEHVIQPPPKRSPSSPPESWGERSSFLPPTDETTMRQGHEETTLRSSGPLEPRLPQRPSVLFLAANPTQTDRVRLDREAKAIRNALIRAQAGARFRFHAEYAVTVHELIRALLERRPDIVHFGGHGAGESGIFLEQDGDGAVLLSPNSLREILAEVRAHVKIVVLNACNTWSQAQEAAEVIAFAVGTTAAVTDEAARAFSESFYTALAYDQKVHGAFQLAKAAAATSAPGYGELFSLASLHPPRE